jgi:neurofibromin 1
VFGRIRGFTDHLFLFLVGLEIDAAVIRHSARLSAIETLVELSIVSLDIIAWALSQLLDRLSKQTDPHSGHITIEVLQSQLFVLKLLSLTMASRCTQHSSSSDSSESDRSPTLSDLDSTGTPTTYSWEEPPPLDDSCIKHILSVMVLFI